MEIDEYCAMKVERLFEEDQMISIYVVYIINTSTFIQCYREQGLILTQDRYH